MIDLDEEIRKDKEKRRNEYRRERHERHQRHDAGSQVQLESNTGEMQRNYDHRTAPRERLLVKVTNLHYSVTREELEAQFRKFGAIKMCRIEWDRMGRSKETATVQFVDRDDHRDAVRSMNGFSINEQAINVESVTETITPKRHDISKGGFGERHRQNRYRNRDRWD